MKLSKKLLKQIEDAGFSVSRDDDYGSYTFQRYSPEGQDFFFEISGKTKDEFIQNIAEYYEGYDVSYEAYLWLDDWGHGRNGAPYDMKDVYEDMVACREYIWELYEIVAGGQSTIKEEVNV